MAKNTAGASKTTTSVRAKKTAVSSKTSGTRVIDPGLVKRKGDDDGCGGYSHCMKPYSGSTVLSCPGDSGDFTLEDLKKHPETVNAYLFENKKSVLKYFKSKGINLKK